MDRSVSQTFLIAEQKRAVVDFLIFAEIDEIGGYDHRSSKTEEIGTVMSVKIHSKELCWQNANTCITYMLIPFEVGRPVDVGGFY